MAAAGHAQRTMSAPPEVVFNTATDPDRLPGWLPAPLRQDGARPDLTDGGGLCARWVGATAEGWSAELTVAPMDSGGATARLRIDAKQADDQLSAAADEALANLAREVDDDLAAG